MLCLGDAADIDAVRSQRARELIRLLEREDTAFVQQIAFRQSEQRDILEVEFDLSVPQHRAVDIRTREPVAIVFAAEEDIKPAIVPLREDFPNGFVHVMVGRDGLPPSFCVWDAPFEEMRGNLTPLGLLTAVKDWLEAAASGALDETDAPVEPVLRDACGTVILPGLPTNGSAPPLVVTAYTEEQSGIFTARLKDASRIGKSKENEQFVVGTFPVGPIPQQATQLAPNTLAELSEFLAQHGAGFLEALTAWTSEINVNVRQEAKPIFLLQVRKWVNGSAGETRDEYWAFVCGEPLGELAVALGVMGRDPETRQLVQILSTLMPDKAEPNLSEIRLDPLSVRFEVGRDELAEYSGEEVHEPLKIAAVGVGALGSAVAMHCARAGFGNWGLIDPDVFLPHNAARHLLGDEFYGRPKADSVKEVGEWLLPHGAFTAALTCDVIRPQKHSEDLGKALAGADLILDMSASVGAARALCEREESAPRVSMFLNASGSDLVVLAESKNRGISLWDLEAQYYAHVVQVSELAGHMCQPDGMRRYGNGCRDVSLTLSGDDVGVLAGIGSRQLRQLSKQDGAFAGVWRYDPSTGSVWAVKLLCSEAHVAQLGAWEVRWSRSFAEQLSERRQKALPNETGGALFGIVDREHRVIVVSAEIAAPSDSVERPSCFIRGTQSLNDQARRYGEETLGQLRYLGEWHSHPDGVAAFPSATDEEMFAGMRAFFDGTSEPLLMAILGEKRLFVRCATDDDVDQGLMYGE